MGCRRDSVDDFLPALRRRSMRWSSKWAAGDQLVDFAHGERK
jgi:hypothetical protein